MIFSGNAQKSNNKDLIDLLDKIDAAYPDKDVVVTSCLRSPEQQEGLRQGSGFGKNGQRVSQHVLGTAADIKVEGVSSSDLADKSKELGAKGTISYGPDKGHSHVDVRNGPQFHDRRKTGGGILLP